MGTVRTGSWVDWGWCGGGVGYSEVGHVPLDVRNDHRIERRCGVTVLVKPLPESLFGPGFRGGGYSEAVTRKFFLGPDSGNTNILLLLFSCTNKRTCGDMQDR